MTTKPIEMKKRIREAINEYDTKNSKQARYIEQATLQMEEEN